TRGVDEAPCLERRLLGSLAHQLNEVSTVGPALKAVDLRGRGVRGIGDADGAPTVGHGIPEHERPRPLAVRLRRLDLRLLRVLPHEELARGEEINVPDAHVRPDLTM